MKYTLVSSLTRCNWELIRKNNQALPSGLTSIHAEMAVIENFMRENNLWSVFQAAFKNEYCVLQKSNYGKINYRPPKGKFVITTIRYINDGTIRSARPCESCGRWIMTCRAIGINLKVVHSTDVGTLIEWNGICSKYRPKHTIL